MDYLIKSIKESKYEATFRYGEIVKGNRIDTNPTDNTLLEISEDGKIDWESVYLRKDSFSKAHLRSISVSDEKGKILRTFRANSSPNYEALPADLILNTFNKDEQLVEKHKYHIDESISATEWSNALGSLEAEIPTKLLELFATLKERTSVKYNQQGKKIEECCFDANGNLISKETKNYDESGKMIELKKVNSKNELIHKQKIKYDRQGQIIEHKFYITNLILDRVVQYERDKNGNVEWTQEFNTEGEVNYKMKAVFDDNGNEIEGYEYNDDGSLEGKSVYAYDEKNQLIERAEYNDKGELLLQASLAYDEKGNETQSATTYFDDDLTSRLTKYEYDINDFCIREEYYQNDIPQKIIEREIECYI